MDREAWCLVPGAKRGLRQSTRHKAQGAFLAFVLCLLSFVLSVPAASAALSGGAWYAGLSSWMAPLRDETPLARIMMPAAHDAGMAEDWTKMTGWAWFLGKKIACTQSLNIAGQLAAGTRYFDIRPYCDDGEMRTCHLADDLGGGLGESLKSIFGGAADFVAAHPTETAIFCLSHWRDDSDKATVVNFIKSNYGAALYKSAKAENLNAIALGKVRGKIIVTVSSASGFVDPPGGIWGYCESSFARDGYLNVYDEYADSNDFNEMKEDQFGKWAAHGGEPETRAFLLSWTETVQSSDWTKLNIRNMAKTANGNLADGLREGLLTKGWTRPTFVYLDYVSESLCRTVVDYNWDLTLSTASTIDATDATLSSDGRTLTVGGRTISRAHYRFELTNDGYRPVIDPSEAKIGDVGERKAFALGESSAALCVPKTVSGFWYAVRYGNSPTLADADMTDPVAGDGTAKVIEVVRPKKASAQFYKLVVGD